MEGKPWFSIVALHKTVLGKTVLTVLFNQNKSYDEPDDADDLGRPGISLFEFQMVHRYVFRVVQFCLKWCNLDLHMVYM